MSLNGNNYLKRLFIKCNLHGSDRFNFEVDENCDWTKLYSLNKQVELHD